MPSSVTRVECRFDCLLSTRRDAVPIKRDFMIDAERTACAKTASG